jgi:hypothetical protein
MTEDFIRFGLTDAKPLDRKNSFAVILTLAQITFTPGFAASDSNVASKAFPTPLADDFVDHTRSTRSAAAA